jgi:putative membrane protein
MKSASIVCISALFLAAGGAFAQGGPTDPQIAHIVVTANQVDIDAGKLAETKGTNKAVKAFGKQMVTDHTGVNQQAVALVTKLKVTPEDNPTSQASGGRRGKRQEPPGAEWRGIRQSLHRSRSGVCHVQVLEAIDTKRWSPTPAEN